MVEFPVRRFEYRLVDANGWGWPDTGSSPEDLDGDLAYMEERHPGKGWHIQVRIVSAWQDMGTISISEEED